MLSKNTTNCVGWATKLDDLLKFASQICDIVSVGGIQWLLIHGQRRFGLRRLLAKDTHLVVSTTVVVPDFAAANRVPDGKKEGLLFCARKNICELD